MRKIPIVLFLLIAVGTAAWFFLNPLTRASKETAEPSRADALEFSKKLANLSAPSKAPSPRTLEITEREIEAFLHYELSPSFPQGLHEVHLKLLNDSIAAKARVNFDEIQSANNAKKNILMNALLAGEHTLEIVGNMKVQNKMGSYDIQEVRLDGTEIPKPLVDFMITRFVLPKYPAAKPNTAFEMPYEIEKIDIRQGKLVVYQGRS